MFDDIIKNSEENWWEDCGHITPLEFDDKGNLIRFSVDYPEIEEKVSEQEVFAKARYVMGEHIFNDEGLEIGYRANIAMFLNDRCGITNHEKRNKLAKELMELIWKS